MVRSRCPLCQKKVSPDRKAEAVCDTCAHFLSVSEMAILVLRQSVNYFKAIRRKSYKTRELICELKETANQLKPQDGEDLLI